MRCVHSSFLCAAERGPQGGLIEPEYEEPDRELGLVPGQSWWDRRETWSRLSLVGMTLSLLSLPTSPQEIFQKLTLTNRKWSCADQGQGASVSSSPKWDIPRCSHTAAATLACTHAHVCTLVPMPHLPMSKWESSVSYPCGCSEDSGPGFQLSESEFPLILRPCGPS